MADMVAARPKARVPKGTLIGGVTALAALLVLLPLIAFAVLRPAVGSGTRVSVVVAARDIPIRTPVKADDLTVRQFALDDVPPGAFLKTDQLKGMVAAANLAKGQAVTSNLVAKSTDAVSEPDFAYLPLPSGYVAMTIPANELQAVAGYVRAGDYISVIATVAPQSGGGSNTRTVFTNLHVLRVGQASQNDARPATPPGQSAAPAQVTASSLTVELTQCQAEVMNWFLSNAQVKYTLESYKDYQPADKADQSCPRVTNASGMTKAQIASKYPGIFN